MTEDTISLSPRHERFVAEYLKDGNATQAYIRAGYAPRGAQPCASRLLRDHRIAAALAAGRQRITESLAVSVERVTEEYAKIAFACVDDLVSTDADGRLRLDLEKAGKAQRAGIVELKFTNHSKQEQQVTLKLGKLQALAALNKQLGGPVGKPKLQTAAETAASTAGLRELLHTAELLGQAKVRAERAERALAEARAALPTAPAPDDRPPDGTCEAAPPAAEPTKAPAEEPQAAQPQIVPTQASAPNLQPKPGSLEEVLSVLACPPRSRGTAQGTEGRTLPQGTWVQRPAGEHLQVGPTSAEALLEWALDVEGD